MTDHIERITRFFEKWKGGAAAFHDSIRELFTDETVWVNVGYSRTVGADEAIAFLGKGEAVWGRDAIHVEMLHIAQVGDVVLTERIDHEHHKDGHKLFSVPVAGILELSPDGKIVEWREYFDTAPIVAKRDAAAAS